MIRRLRKKFILAAVAAVFLVLLLLIGSINVLNYRSLLREADATLEILAQNKGVFPRQMFRPPELPGEMPDAPPTGNRGDIPDMRPFGSGELAYQSRYFTVGWAVCPYTTDREASVLSWSAPSKNQKTRSA